MGRKRNILEFWITIGVVTLGALIFTCMNTARGDGAYHSRDGWEGYISLTTELDSDSAWAIFGFPNLTVTIDTVHLYPTTDSTVLYGTGLALDSLGLHMVVTKSFPRGSGTAKVDTSYWYHEGPGRITAASPSGSYICRVYGYMSDIGSDYVSGAVVTARLEKRMVYDTCAGILVFEREKQTRPSGSSGYFELDLIRSSCIGDEKYKITVTKSRRPDVTQYLTVPDSTTYYMTWGN